MASEEEHERVAAAIRSLPKRLRVPFVRVFVEQTPYAEVERELRLSPRALNRRLARGLVLCRRRT